MDKYDRIKRKRLKLSARYRSNNDGDWDAEYLDLILAVKVVESMIKP